MRREAPRVTERITIAIKHMHSSEEACQSSRGRSFIFTAVEIRTKRKRSHSAEYPISQVQSVLKIFRKKKADLQAYNVSHHGVL